MKCTCKALEEARSELKVAQKRIREQERDLIALARRCAALAETLKVAVKENRHDGL